MEFDIKFLMFCGSAFAFSVILTVCIILLATSKQHPFIYRSKKEKSFVDPKLGIRSNFPSITDKATIHLSVIVPAYNEEIRLRPMLDECIGFLEERAKSRSSFKYEIIIVSDGSTDKTVSVATEYCTKLGTDKFRILELETNRGKGGAVRLGIQSARGAYLLFADADGATKFSDLCKLELSLGEFLKCDYIQTLDIASEKLAISIGSRAHLQDDALATRSVFRNILMYGFHFLVWIFAVRAVRDTQCGFKLLTRRAAKYCFQNLHVERWAFDVELLYIAEFYKIPITEIAVNWTEIEGSKITPFWSWVQMAKDLGFIWLRYLIGAWKIEPKKIE